MVFPFSLFDFVIHFSLMAFHFSYSFFAFRFSFFAFRFSLFDIPNQAEYRILTFKLRPNIVFLHSKSYFDILIGAEYRILDIQNPILKFQIGPNIVF